MSALAAVKRALGVDGGFAVLVAEACEAERALREMQGDWRAWKLSPEAFAIETQEVARSTPEKLNTLRHALEDEASAPGVEHVNATLRRMLRAVRSRNFNGPPREERRIAFLLDEPAESGLGGLRSSPLELFALAARIAGERWPGDFGVGASSAAIKERFATLKARRDELFVRVGSEFTPLDLITEYLPGQGGLARVTFKLSDGQVNVAPVENAGERLVGWMLAQTQ